MTDEGKASVGFKRGLVAAGIGLVVATGLILAVVWGFQGRLLYGKPWDHQKALPGWSEVRVPVEGVGDIAAYRLPAKNGNPVILFLHGSGYGYADATKAVKGFTDSGMGVLIPEYPGYGGNPGSLNEGTAKATAAASLAWLTRNGVKAEDVILYGEGFGAGAAISAAKMPHRRLLVVSGIADMPAVVQAKYPLVPTWFIRDKWYSVPEIKQVKGRVTVVHAPDDTFTPVAQGEALAKAGRTMLISVPGGSRIAFAEGLQSALAGSMAQPARK